MSQANFEASIAEARKYEMSLSQWLQTEYGYYVLPTYDYSGLGENKAPKLYCGESGLVIPDLMACLKGHTCWMECKWKTKADTWRKTGERNTGIELRLYNHYQRVEQVSGCPVYIAFLHVREDEVRIERLSVLTKTEHHRDTSKKMSWHGMVFWTYESLPLRARLTELMGNPP